MTAKEYAEFLRQTESMLELIARSYPPARLSPAPRRLFLRKVIDGMRTMLEAPWPQATQVQRAEAQRLVDRLDRIEEAHFLAP
jgi:hypothetical protein